MNRSDPAPQSSRDVGNISRPSAVGAQPPVGAHPGQMGMFISLEGPIEGIHHYFHA